MLDLHKHLNVITDPWVLDTPERVSGMQFSDALFQVGDIPLCKLTLRCTHYNVSIRDNFFKSTTSSYMFRHNISLPFYLFLPKVVEDLLNLHLFRIFRVLLHNLILNKIAREYYYNGCRSNITCAFTLSNENVESRHSEKSDCQPLKLIDNCSWMRTTNHVV